MADTILTEREASLAVEDLGWRYLLDCLTTAVTVDSLFDACEVIRVAVDIAGPQANDHLRLRATPDRVEFTLETRGECRVTWQDVDLARSITKAVRTAGYQTVSHPAHHSVQSLAIAIDATVPHDDAVARVEAALAAGGRLVSDDRARAFWILADVEGNEVCVCTWQDRE